MGMIDVSVLESYWSTSWESEIPFFRKVMPRDRFLQIFWMLHVGEGDAKVDKIKKLCDALIHNFQANYTSNKNLAVDETMVGFKGRFSAKQYMPNKPTKYGIKAFTLASSEHGYMLNILLYVGANTLQGAENEYKILPQPACVVMELMKPYFNKCHHIYTDRYYSSIPLAQALQQKKTDITGTIMKNWIGLPDTVRSKSFSLKDDEMRSFCSGSLLTVAWRAASKKKPLIMLSTSSSNTTVNIQSRYLTQKKPLVVDSYNKSMKGVDSGSLLTVAWRAASKKKPLIMLSTSSSNTTVNIQSRYLTQKKPLVVDSYNKSMNGVDRADQYTVYYSFVRRSVQWWRKVFFWLMEVAAVNSYLL